MCERFASSGHLFWSFQDYKLFRLHYIWENLCHNLMARIKCYHRTHTEWDQTWKRFGQYMYNIFSCNNNHFGEMVQQLSHFNRTESGPTCSINFNWILLWTTTANDHDKHLNIGIASHYWESINSMTITQTNWYLDLTKLLFQYNTHRLTVNVRKKFLPMTEIVTPYLQESQNLI